MFKVTKTKERLQEIIEKIFEEKEMRNIQHLLKFNKELTKRKESEKEKMNSIEKAEEFKICKNILEHSE